MRCSKAENMMSEALDGALPAKEWGVLNDHLAQCPRCGQTFAALQEMGGVLRQLGPFHAPPALIRRLRLGLHLHSTPPRSFLLTGWLPYARAMAYALVIGLGVLFGTSVSTSLGLHPVDPGLAALSLDLFQATPPNSLAAGYLAMVENTDEE